jgi:hypothetical protein
MANISTISIIKKKMAKYSSSATVYAIADTMHNEFLSKNSINGYGHIQIKNYGRQQADI